MGDELRGGFDGKRGERRLSAFIESKQVTRLGGIRRIYPFFRQFSLLSLSPIVDGFFPSSNRRRRRTD